MWRSGKSSSNQRARRVKRRRLMASGAPRKSDGVEICPHLGTERNPCFEAFVSISKAPQSERKSVTMPCGLLWTPTKQLWRAVQYREVFRLAPMRSDDWRGAPRDGATRRRRASRLWSSPRQCLGFRQHFRDVARHLHLAPHPGDHPVLADQVGGAVDAHVLAAIHALFHPG